jgi:hypothetical protein
MLNPPVIPLVRNRTSNVANGVVTLDLAVGAQVLAGLENYDSLLFLINVTNAGGATGTVTIFIEDSWDEGATWDDLVSSEAITLGTTSGAQKFVVQGRAAPSVHTGTTITALDQGAAPTQEAMAAGSARQGPFGDRIRIREKVASASGTPSGCVYSIHVVPMRSSLR